MFAVGPRKWAPQLIGTLSVPGEGLLCRDAVRFPVDWIKPENLVTDAYMSNRMDVYICVRDFVSKNDVENKKATKRNCDG